MQLSTSPRNAKMRSPVLPILATTALLGVASARILPRIPSLPAIFGRSPVPAVSVELVKRQSTGTLPGGWIDRECYTYYHPGGYYHPASANIPMSAEFCVDYCRTPNAPPPFPYVALGTKRDLEGSSDLKERSSLGKRKYDGASKYALTQNGQQCGM